MVNVPGFRSIRPKEFKRLLKKKLGYTKVPGSDSGSHHTLRSSGRPDITWAFHDSRNELAPIEVRNILVKQIGLTLEQAKEVMK